jgi:cobalt-precorrin 5A hydrolase/precorrin-3B C17-methyltransferase
MRVLTVSVTAAGAALAERLPYEHEHGGLGAIVRERWRQVDGLVLLCATGVAVRVIAPLLEDKRSDPAVVCVDEAGRYAVTLCGGHLGGANALAREVAGLLGASGVITTATDAAGIAPLDQLPGFAAAGDIAGVSRALLDGEPVAIDNPRGWAPPFGLRTAAGGDARVVITDEVGGPASGVAILHPPSLVAGVGASSGAPVEEVSSLLGAALADAGLARASVAEIATLDIKVDEPAIVALGLPIRTFDAATLAAVVVPNPSAAVRAAVGTASVAEAAALLAAGPGAQLVVSKQKSSSATVAIARRLAPRGHLRLVGLGPGGVAHRTPAATAAVRHAEVVIGYAPYLDQCAELLSPAQEVIRSPIGDEVARAQLAVGAAAAGQRVALVCSGDSGVYAMASLAFEVAAGAGLDPATIEVVPGVTAAIAAAALLGAPLGHDHVSISLSDLLTPWDQIEARVRAAADADLVVTFYNPRSRGRDWQLDKARALLLDRRPPSTPVGIVTDAGRPEERVEVTTLAELDVERVGMTTAVIVGASTSYVVGGRIVTPRGYDR